ENVSYSRFTGTDCHFEGRYEDHRAHSVAHKLKRLGCRRRKISKICGWSLQPKSTAKSVGDGFSLERASISRRAGAKSVGRLGSTAQPQRLSHSIRNGPHDMDKITLIRERKHLNRRPIDLFQGLNFVSPLSHFYRVPLSVPYWNEATYRGILRSLFSGRVIEG